MQPLNARAEVGVHLNAVAVELQLGRVQQRFNRGKARHNDIHRLVERSLSYGLFLPRIRRGMHSGAWRALL